jgi:3-phosphoshikimate 1-carboxyvinyltransferase
MGATFETTERGTLPLTVTGAQPLTGINYELPVASAQVQSALLIAGLAADGPTTVHEPGPLRDHTERMLRAAGVRVDRSGASVTVYPMERMQLPDLVVPADPSAAAPFIVAATLLHGSMLRLPGVMVNPTRNGMLGILERMGATILETGKRDSSGEPVADLEVRHAERLQRTMFEDGEIPRSIDELMLLALVFHFCKGQSTVVGAEELRHKESDRITLLVNALRGIGVNIEERRDGFVVRGSGARPEGGVVHAEGDHRIAMLGGIAGLVSRKGVTIRDADCVSISYPGFFDVLEQVSRR